MDTPRFSYFSHLECSRCNKRVSADQPRNLCECGSPLLARYDLAGIRDSVTPQQIMDRPPTLWRYHELLPVTEEVNVVTVGEGMTPLVPLPDLGGRYQLPNLLLKDEGLLPTGTFKTRGASVGVSKAKELGVTAVAMPTNGNAGSAWAAYAARAGLKALIVMPNDAPLITRSECAIAGAQLYLVDGLINDAGRIVAEAVGRLPYFDVSTFKEPYRLEGKKTMGLELFEQLGWRVPDVIIYPTGGGVGIVGIYKGLLELQSLGWIGSKLPKLVAVQAAGCAPIVKAFQQHAFKSELWPAAKTVAFGITVPKPLADFMILEAVYNTNGCSIAVPDDEMLAAQAECAANEGLFICPEGAATLAAARKLRDSGWLNGDEEVVALNTGAGLKYPETVTTDPPLLAATENLPG